MSLRKAQKHMQRATELLDQSQLGFGTESNQQTQQKSRVFDTISDHTQIQIVSNIKACRPICNLAQVSMSNRQRNGATCAQCKLVVQEEIEGIQTLSKNAQVRLRSYNKMPEVPVFVTPQQGKVPEVPVSVTPQQGKVPEVPMRKLRSDELDLNNFEAGKSFANPALAQKLSETEKEPQTEQELQDVRCEHGPNTDVTYGLLKVTFHKYGRIGVDLDVDEKWIQMEIKKYPGCEVWISDRYFIKNPVELYSMIDIETLVNIAHKSGKLRRKDKKNGDIVYFDPIKSR